jgi:quercetin dioxygenase-like cupin family protein
MQLLNLNAGRNFAMGAGDSRRVVHPDMGAKHITLNRSLFAPGQEFPQHTHGATEDIFVVLAGGVSVRQGDQHWPITAGDAVFIPAGEVHGTVNTTDGQATLISFQGPPDMALYQGARDVPEAERPKPPPGHVSKICICPMAECPPSRGRPGAWRPVIGADCGATHLALDHVTLGPGDKLAHRGAGSPEHVYVLVEGEATLVHEERHLVAEDVIFADESDDFAFEAGPQGATIICCRAVV